MTEDPSVRHYQDQYRQYVEFEKVVEKEYAVLGGRIARHIREQGKQRLIALDVGCGTGKMPLTLRGMLEPEGIEVIFDYLDPVSDALDIYERHVPDGLRRSRIQQAWADFETSEEYDFILSNNSLCGLDLTRGNIDKFSELLSHQGLAIITLPSKRGDWVDYARRFWRGVHETDYPKTYFESLMHAMGETGLTLSQEWVEVPIEVASRELQSVFGVMMYLDPHRVIADSSFSVFQQEVMSRVPPTLRLVYGVAVMRKNEQSGSTPVQTG